MNKTFREAVEDALTDGLTSNPSVVLLGQSPAKYPENLASRVMDIPFGENIAASAALGLAMTGAKPIVFIRGEYLLRSLDTIGNEMTVTDAMYNSQFDSAVVIMSETGYFPHGGPQLSQSFEAMFTQFPSLSVVYPSNPSDAGALLRAAIQHDKSVLFLSGKSLLEESAEVSGEGEEIQIGSASVVREGSEMTIVTYGTMTGVCLKAAELANESGLSCEVIDLRTVHPIDSGTIVESVKKTGKLMIVHEARKTGGIGAEIAARIAESDALFYLERKIMRVCSKDSEIPYSQKEYGKVVPNEEDVLKAIIQLSTGE